MNLAELPNKMTVFNLFVVLLVVAVHESSSILIRLNLSAGD